MSDQCLKCGAPQPKTLALLTAEKERDTLADRLRVLRAELASMASRLEARNEQEEDKRAQLMQRVVVAENDAIAARKEASDARGKLKAFHDVITGYLSALEGAALEGSMARGILMGIGRASKEDHAAEQNPPAAEPTE